MLKLSQTILNRPVLSLRAGRAIASVIKPIINPNNLKIEGFYCQDRYSPKKELILLSQDIRETLSDGIVVNDHDALSEPSDLLRLEGIIKLNFQIIGLQVMTVSKSKIGKVSDYAIEVTTMYIQKIYVSQSILRSFSGGSLTIDRTQIVEITNRSIIINDLEQSVRAHAAAVV